ncbi:hypothetical protein SAMN05216409_102214 [Pseudomonas lutea]|uniref:Uncharacterized protein n=1 Tax=Pseudomonas lutea TaxID=243924 RepID=A0A9X8M9J0_9PSED|nr:hypothetical protein SAMN05216409_102214 [Pseudomonas lutea]
MGGAFSVTGVLGDVIRAYDALALEGWRKDGGVTRHGKISKRFARYTRQRIQHVTFTLLVQHVVEERAELRMNQRNGCIGRFLHQLVQVQFGSQASANPVENLKAIHVWRSERILRHD